MATSHALHPYRPWNAGGYSPEFMQPGTRRLLKSLAMCAGWLAVAVVVPALVASVFIASLQWMNYVPGIAEGDITRGIDLALFVMGMLFAASGFVALVGMVLMMAFFGTIASFENPQPASR